MSFSPPKQSSRAAEQQIRAAADRYAERSRQVAEDWFFGIKAAVLELASSAERFGVARENDQLPLELRERPYGLGKRITHRILFSIEEDHILVHQIRHVSQRDSTEEE